MTSNPSPEEKRADYIAGLRLLADALERSPEVPLPYEGIATDMTFHFLHGDDPKAAMAACARALPTSFTKDADGKYFDLHGKLAGLRVNLVAFRAEVCERVVTGTRQVEIEEPDPEALAAVPTVTRIEVVEDVEWVCSPILAATEEKAPVSA